MIYKYVLVFLYSGIALSCFGVVLRGLTFGVLETCISPYGTILWNYSGAVL